MGNGQESSDDESTAHHKYNHRTSPPIQYTQNIHTHTLNTTSSSPLNGRERSNEEGEIDGGCGWYGICTSSRTFVVVARAAFMNVCDAGCVCASAAVSLSPLLCWRCVCEPSMWIFSLLCETIYLQKLYGRHATRRRENGNSTREGGALLCDGLRAPNVRDGKMRNLGG